MKRLCPLAAGKNAGGVFKYESGRKKLMEYQEARMYVEKAAKYGIVPGLIRVRRLLNALDRPDRLCRVIHVAGTNGKGSTCAYLESILMRAGYNVGRYSSPEIRDYLDRFSLNGKPVTKPDFISCMDIVKTAADREIAAGMEKPTAFEIETALAFLYFSKKKCDIAIVEAGMGGTMDATNVIEHPLMTVITSISLDHTAYLGDCVAKIAGEKAGIIKGGHPVVVGVQPEEALEVLRKAYEAQEQKYRIETESTGQTLKSYFAPVKEEEIRIQKRTLKGQYFSYKGEAFMTKLLGTCQAANAANAVLAAEALKELGFEVKKEHIRDGIAKAEWPYRFTVIPTRPVLVLDGAHNPDGARRLSESVKEYFTNRRVVFIIGVFKDKDYEGILNETVFLCGSLYTVPLPDRSRGLCPEELCAAVKERVRKKGVCKDYYEAARMAGEDAGKDGVVVSFGSLSYLPAMENAWRDCYGQGEN